MKHEGLFIEKKSHLLESSKTQPSIFQAVEKVEHRFVWYRHILETLVILSPGAVFLLRVGKPLVDVGESAMNLELSVAAIIINILKIGLNI